MRQFVSLFVFLTAVWSTIASSKAAVICEVFEGANSLTFKYSGTIDLSTVTAVGPTLAPAVSFSSQQSYFQNGARMIFTTGSTSPSVVLGNGGTVAATYVKPGSSPFHFDFINKTLGLSVGYITGSPIEGEVTIFGSLAYHGMAPGTRSYSWAGGAESVTLNVYAVPEPGSMSIFAIGSIVAGYRLHRRKSKTVD